MTVQFKRLVSAAALTGSAASYYSSNAKTANITAATAYNPTAAPVDVKVYLVPNGGSANDAATVALKSIPAGQTAPLTDLVGHKIEAQGQIYAAGNGCTLNISGVEAS